VKCRDAAAAEPGVSSQAAKWNHKGESPRVSAGARQVDQPSGATAAARSCCVLAPELEPQFAWVRSDRAVAQLWGVLTGDATLPRKLSLTVEMSVLALCLIYTWWQRVLISYLLFTSILFFRSRSCD